MEPLTLNIIIAAIALVSCWYQMRLYRIVRSPAFLLMALAMAYLTVYRIVLPFAPCILDYGAILPFFGLVLAHTVYLYRLLSRFLIKGR